MKKTIFNGTYLREEFVKYNRDYFSADGYDALVNFYDEIDEDMEVDVIAICCECTEYSGYATCDIDDMIGDYGYIYTKEEYAARNAKLQEKISETILAIDNAKKSIPATIDYADKISRFKECVAILQDDSVQALTKNTMLKSCIQRIEYTNHMDSKPGIGRYVENEFSIELFLQN